MTPPTLYELAGIFMLALVTTILISHPSAGSYGQAAAGEAPWFENLTATPIDGIESVALPGR